MSLSSPPTHWTLQAAEYHQLAVLIANMVEDHLRATSVDQSTCSPSIEQEIDHGSHGVIS